MSNFWKNVPQCSCHLGPFYKSLEDEKGMNLTPGQKFVLWGSQRSRMKIRFDCSVPVHDCKGNVIFRCLRQYGVTAVSLSVRSLRYAKISETCETFQQKEFRHSTREINFSFAVHCVALEVFSNLTNGGIVQWLVRHSENAQRMKRQKRKKLRKKRNFHCPWLGLISCLVP